MDYPIDRYPSNVDGVSDIITQIRDGVFVHHAIVNGVKWKCASSCYPGTHLEGSKVSEFKREKARSFFKRRAANQALPDKDKEFVPVYNFDTQVRAEFASAGIDVPD